METIKQEEYLGRGSLKKLGEIIKRLGAKRIFIVTGGQSYEQSGAKSTIEPFLSNKTVQLFSDFQLNPKIEDIERGIEEFRRFAPDLVIAVGGGSALDMAKAINLLSVQARSPESYVAGEQKIIAGGSKLIAIPTTSGSGSEATHFAVVYMAGKKYSLANPVMRPTIAIVDPTLTDTLPSKITATSGADALCQAIESLWSVNSTEESREYSREALTLAWGNLKEAVLAPTSSSREAMSRAAHLAGKAINIAKTTASHALSYPFTTEFGIPHGQAVGLTIGPVLVYNSQVQRDDLNDPRGLEYVRHIIDDVVKKCGGKSPREAAEKIQTLFAEIGLELKLSRFGIGPKDLELLLDGASLERMKNNPRQISRAAAKQLLASIE